MTNICKRMIEDPGAWIGERLGGKEAVTYRLGREELEAIDLLLERTRDRGVHEVRAPEFNSPVLDRTLEKLLRIIMDGRGFVIVSGLTPERYTDEQMERVYWGFGTHWGRAAVQSVYGDLMGYVQVNEQDPYARAYRSADELAFHCDTYELVGLMCVQRAEEGGTSRMVSSLTVHNEMLRRYPELLAPLYEGYYLAPPELQHSERPVTDVKTPVFCYRDGLVSCTYAANFMKRAAERRGEALPEALVAAIGAFDEIVSEPRLQLNVRLEPGDMMFWQNFTNLHARTSFKNSAIRRRKLLRLWLTPESPRPVDPRFHSRAQAYAWYYEREKAKQR